MNYQRELDFSFTADDTLALVTQEGPEAYRQCCNVAWQLGFEVDEVLVRTRKPITPAVLLECRKNVLRRMAIGGNVPRAHIERYVQYHLQ